MHLTAKETDRKFNPQFNQQGGGMGPVQSYLNTFGRVKGLIFGAFGEGSPDVHALIHLISVKGAERGWRPMGASSAGDAAAALKRQAERSIGIEAVRGHARLKLDRLAWMTGDMDAGAKRRSNARYGADVRRHAYVSARVPRVWAPRQSRHAEW